MSGPKARIGVRLDGDESGLSGAFNRASAKASAFAAKMRGIGKGFAGAFTLGAVGLGARAIIGEADAIQDTAEAYRLTTDELQAFQAVARTGKGGIEGLDGSLRKLNESQAKAIEGEKAQLEAFAALGITQEELTLSTADLFQRVASGYTKTQNLAAATSILGKQTQGTTGFMKELAEQGVQGMIDKQRELNQVMSSESIDALARYDDAMQAMGKGIKTTFANNVLPTMELLSGIIGGLSAGKGVSESIQLSREVMAEKTAEAEKKQADMKASRESEYRGIQAAAATAKMQELRTIISSARGEPGLGSSLVKIGARGGIAGGDSPAVKVAKEQLAALKEVASNTEGIDKIQTGILIP